MPQNAIFIPTKVPLALEVYLYYACKARFIYEGYS